MRNESPDESCYDTDILNRVDDDVKEAASQCIGNVFVDQ